jgi:CheY-like chemotaxis protein
MLRYAPATIVESTTMTSPHIVVVDDDPAVLDLLTEFLALEGYDAAGFRTTADALASVREHRPVLLIMDLHGEHPDSGLAALCTLKGDPATIPIPVILLSGDATAPAKVAQLQVDTVTVLLKPCTLTELAAVVAQLCVTC